MLEDKRPKEFVFFYPCTYVNIDMIQFSKIAINLTFRRLTSTIVDVPHR